MREKNLIIALGTGLAGLLVLAEQNGATVTPRDIAHPKYHSLDFEAACGAFVFKSRFRNGRSGTSRVHHALIDGRPVPGAAKTLDRFAAGRPVDYIGIMNCGIDPENPVFRGVIQLLKPESQPHSRRTSLYFRMFRHGEHWRIAVD